jgi:predicted lipoprotein with Yx(FWY)xxD motif
MNINVIRKVWPRSSGGAVKAMVGVLIGMLLLLAACQSATPPPAATQPLSAATEEPLRPTVVVEDQSVSDGEVTVPEVVSPGAGWLVIHAQADGGPGPILGYTELRDGLNENVHVKIDTAKATERLYAMLHTDSGTPDEFEFPNGPDAPIKVDAKMVAPSFIVSGLPNLLPRVSVEDQEIKDGTVTVNDVVSNGPGWLVIHAQADGKPGPILGYTPLKDGENKDVAVEIDIAKATETIYAMLHTDVGEMGAFEFPDGPDTPVKVDDKVVTPSFAISGLPGLTPAVSVQDQEIKDGVLTIAEVNSAGPGWLVVHAQADGSPGPILGYTQVEDGVNKDVAVEIDSAEATGTVYAMLHTDAGEAGKFEFPGGPDVPVKVDDQVVTPPFMITGGLGPLPVVLLGGNDELGQFLTGRNGLTLYVFTKDTVGVSNCYDQCAANWPPLLVNSGQELLVGEGVSGKLGTIERSDGGMQVTYNGLPLYFWIGDTAPGDATGNGFNNIWFVATTNTAPQPSISNPNSDSNKDKDKDSRGGY